MLRSLILASVHNLESCLHNYFGHSSSHFDCGFAECEHRPRRRACLPRDLDALWHAVGVLEALGSSFKYPGWVHYHRARFSFRKFPLASLLALCCRVHPGCFHRREFHGSAAILSRRGRLCFGLLRGPLVLWHRLYQREEDKRA